MRTLSWLPLRYVIRRAARSQGFLDPVELLARLRSLAQPSEVGEPIELLRAGVVFHARGLINSKVIQHNMDWLWPYWIERQYNPEDISFAPRAFAITHINQTHRNWTAIGYPDLDHFPIVDPRGLLTPLLDSWSLDTWLISEDGRKLLPSRAANIQQRYVLDDGLAIETVCSENGLHLTLTAAVRLDNEKPVCEMHIAAADNEKTRTSLIVSARPCNPEGISSLTGISLALSRREWIINQGQRVEFDRPANRHVVSSYADGDVFLNLFSCSDKNDVECTTGLATGAALFDLAESGTLKVTVPLDDDSPVPLPPNAWETERNLGTRLDSPDEHYNYLHDTALSSLILHSPRDVYPGPYTYKRFWFRDAAFIIHALLCCGLHDRARRAIDEFFHRQTALGYFRSQEGEWDSNGQVLWTLQRYRDITGLPTPEDWYAAIGKGARWIIRKLMKEESEAPHAGLLPAGFSAEHLGPNDYYYWDDFWAVAGLRAAASLLHEVEPEASREFREAADGLSDAIDRSLAACKQRLRRPAMPAAPYRRLDAGAIGSITAGYPLGLFSPDDVRLLDCVDFLMENCFVHGAFFQDMIHSGMNAYLTLQTAQVLLRAGDSRYLDLMDSVAGLASPTGQWPEAIHPQTLGGCMGDGHHVWASAEWLLMVRSCFVQEEGSDRLILGAGIPERWLRSGKPISYGPVHTTTGSLSIQLTTLDNDQLKITWQPRWHEQAPTIRIAVPGYQVISQQQSSALLQPLDNHHD